MATMHVEVVSAEKQLFSGEAIELYARALDGEIGVLPGHQPAVIALDIGPVNIRLEGGGNERIAVHNGFLYVGRDRTIVLADSAELASEIDTARAEARVRELEQQLASEDDAGLRASLAKARLRVDVATRG